MVEDNTHTIAIPAYNEAQGIGTLLGMLCTATPASVREILVCDNASTDGMAEIVRGWEQRSPLVRLVTAITPGKPAAWNWLMDTAESDIVIFLDADAIPQHGCLERMIDATNRSDCLVYGARRHFALPADRLSQRLIGMLADPVIELCVSGPCYAVRRNALRERMARNGFDDMPGVFAEDIWLNACLEPGELAILHDCVVDVRIDSLNYYLQLQARKLLVHYELSQTFPAMAAQLDAAFPYALDPARQLQAVLFGSFDAYSKLRWLSGAVAKGCVNTICRRHIRQQARNLIRRYKRFGGSAVLRALVASRVCSGRAEVEIVG